MKKRTDEFWEEVSELNTDEEKAAFASANGLTVGSLERGLRRFKSKNGQGEDRTAYLVKFLSKGRTEQELEEAGINKEELTVDGYELYETRNSYMETIYLLLPEVAPVEVKPRIWTHRWAPSGRPYLWVQFPKTKWDKIKIVPLADVHFGHHAHKSELFREYVNWIASRDDVYCVIVGDLLENAHGDSNKGTGMYSQDLRPKSQLNGMAELLAPIAHKILWAIPGNHEDRSATRDYDPLERLCEKLGIPYSWDAIYVDVLWMGRVFTFHCKHGRSASRKEGGKLNAAIESLHMQEHVCFEISAHVHDAVVKKKDRIIRDRVNFDLVQRKQYVIICPAFLEYFNTYASKGGWEPGASGTINCELFPNGDYHAGS